MSSINIVVGLITNRTGNVLLVRKRNTRIFIQPGGKKEPGEPDLVTLMRELREELGVSLLEATARSLGTYTDVACNELDTMLEATVVGCQIEGEPEPSGEIEELAWVDVSDTGCIRLAPLTANVILPLARQLRTGACHIA